MVSVKAITAAAILATVSADACLPLDPTALLAGVVKLIVDLVANLSHALVDTGHGLGSVVGLLLQVVYALDFGCIIEDLLDLPTDLSASIGTVLNTLLTIPDGLDAILANSPLSILGGLANIL